MRYLCRATATMKNQPQSDRASRNLVRMRLMVAVGSSPFAEAATVGRKKKKPQLSSRPCAAGALIVSLKPLGIGSHPQQQAFIWRSPRSIGGVDGASPWDHKKPDAIGGVRNIEVGGPRSLSSRTCTLGRTCWCALKRHPRVVRFLEIYFYAILGWSSCSIHSNQIGGWGAVYNLLSSSGAAKSGRPGVKFSSTGGVGTSPRLDAVGKGWAHPC